MSGDEEAKAAEVERLAAREKRIAEQPDGSLLVHLLQPISLKSSTKRSSLQVVPAKARHLREAQRAIRLGENQLDAYADQLTQPKNAHLEVDNMEDYQTVREAVDRQLGKFLRTGQTP